MKKRDIVLILVILLLACALLGVGLVQRGRITVPTAQPTENIMPSAEPTDGGEASAAGASAAVRAAVAAYFDESLAESYMVVTTQNGVHAPVPLNEENELRLAQADGSENVIHIGKNCFYMASSNCENQNCVQQGEVTLENRDTRILFNMVICLPHNLSLQLLSRAETEELLTELYTQAEAAGVPFGADSDAQ